MPAEVLELQRVMEEWNGHLDEQPIEWNGGTVDGRNPAPVYR